MRKYLVLLALATTTLAGCMATPTERGLGGAIAGAAIADAMDENMVAGAALGAIAGAASCGLPGLAPCRSY